MEMPNSTSHGCRPGTSKPLNRVYCQCEATQKKVSGSVRFDGGVVHTALGVCYICFDEGPSVTVNGGYSREKDNGGLKVSVYL